MPTRRWASSRLLSIAGAVSFGLAGMCLVTEAGATASYDSAYGYPRTWNAGLRMIRVDLGLKVEEKDDASGYILFEYKSPESGAKTSSGSMEFVKPKDDDSPVKVMVQLPAMPHYHEQVLLDQLARKMREEYGEPPPKHVKDPEPKDPKDKDAGPSDAGDDAN